MEEARKGHWAIIVSAGTGARMGGDVSKGLLKIDGIPVISFSLAVFQAHRMIDAICLVVHEKWIHEYMRIIEEMKFRKVEYVIAGGVTRRESVHNGLRHVGEFAKRVIIHDGARPFLESHYIDNLLAALRDYPAATLGHAVTDTIKRVDEQRIIKEEIPRTGLIAMQTPQAFRYRDIMNAHIAAEKKGLDATDDTSLMTRMGIPVKVIEGSPVNLKITHQADLYTAELILRKMRKAGTVKL